MDASAAAEGHNPLCGDKITVYVRIDDDSITDVSFEGAGCAISQASASIMTEQVAHSTKAAASDCIAEVMNQFDRDQEDPPAMRGDMAALAGVRDAGVENAQRRARRRTTKRDDRRVDDVWTRQ